ncbi:MAG TPA: DNA-formamidopyrimidine glycosylase family protein [Dehalococcoidia bacterium]
MPEIPDLEGIRGFLNARIVGAEITHADVFIPVVVRTGTAEFIASLTGNRFGEILRHGKFLLFALADEHVLVINAMLTGRFEYVDPKLKKRAKTVFTLTLDTGMQLRYVDERVMGKIYLVHTDHLASVPMFAEMGPDALAVSEDEFRQRIKKFTGMTKNVLTNHKFIAGIGNAYSDEILFAARIDPFRKRSTLSDEEIGHLYRGMRDVFDWANPILADHFREGLDYQEWREHLKVHRKGFEGPKTNRDEGRCPRCGHQISQISPNQRVTSWCRNCQR